MRFLRVMRVGGSAGAGWIGKVRLVVRDGGIGKRGARGRWKKERGRGGRGRWWWWGGGVGNVRGVGARGPVSDRRIEAGSTGEDTAFWDGRRVLLQRTAGTGGVMVSGWGSASNSRDLTRRDGSWRCCCGWGTDAGPRTTFMAKVVRARRAGFFQGTCAGNAAGFLDPSTPGWQRNVAIFTSERRRHQYY